MLTKIDKVVEKICTKVALASICSLFFLMCMTGIHVIMRKFTPVSVPDSIGLTECSMIVIVFLSMGYLQVNKGHIRVDIVVDRFPPRLRSFIEAIILVGCTVILLIVMYANILQAQLQYSTNLATGVLKIPLWPFFVVVCIGLLLFAVSTAVHAALSFENGIRGTAPASLGQAENQMDSVV